jgi:3-methyladenine DNA glycosylase AlkD
MSKSLARKILAELRSAASPTKAKILARFFKTGRGEYGEGDVFLGVTVPQQRMVVKKYYQDISLLDLVPLLQNKYHECRMTAVLILVEKYRRAEPLEKLEIYNFYWHNVNFINNWDLVDLSAPQIVGGFLLNQKSPKALLRVWLKSENLWVRRIAVISTFAFLRTSRADETVMAARFLLKDKHDLIHKAVGWMLRELGKRVDESLLIEFLNENAKQMPRVMLRYAIERLLEKQRKFYLSFR